MKDGLACILNYPYEFSKWEEKAIDSDYNDYLLNLNGKAISKMTVSELYDHATRFEAVGKGYEWEKEEECREHGLDMDKWFFPPNIESKIRVFRILTGRIYAELDRRGMLRG